MSTETSLLLLWLVLIPEGAAMKPVVTFTPNYRKIFTTESITMTCDVGSTTGEGLSYHWYKDNDHLGMGNYYQIQSAGTSQSGNYQCRTISGRRSDPVRLDVSDGLVILQTPLYVYEGDKIRLRCHHYPRYKAGQTIFLKDNRVIGGWTRNEDFYIENVNMNTAGIYKCVKEVEYLLLYHLHEEEVSVSVQELFTIPELKLTPPSLIEGDPVTLTCDTSLTPHRQTTELQFAFFRETQIRKGYSSSNTVGAQSVQLADAGRYFCEVKTSDNKVQKRSNGLNIVIQELFSTPAIKVTPHPVFKKENMTLRCETILLPSRQKTQLQFAFYRGGQTVQRFGANNIYEVHNVQLEDSGKYFCEIGTIDGTVRKRSAEQMIQIEEPLSHPNIAVVNNLMFEGDAMTLTCDTTISPSINRTEVQFAFYRDGRTVQGFSSSNKYDVQFAQVEDSGNYTCEVKTSINTTMRRSDEYNISVQELFSPPVLTVSPEMVTDGDNMTLTCDTQISEHRPSTELQYAFYRDGKSVQGFNSSNKYQVQFIQVEYSGTYTCVIQASGSGVKKESQRLQVQGSNEFPLTTILSVSLGLLLLIVLICIFVYIYYQCRSSQKISEPTIAAEDEYSAEAEVSYTVLNMTSRPQSHLPQQNGSNIVYAEVKSKKQVKASQETHDTSADIYQNISSHGRNHLQM